MYNSHYFFVFFTTKIQFCTAFVLYFSYNPFFDYIKHSRTESIEMTIKFLNNTSINTKKSYLLSVAFLNAFFFASVAMAAGGSTSIQDISGGKAAAPEAVPDTIQSITSTPTAECPLNSGGPSLLGTTWRLESIYGNRVPLALNIDMRVSTHSLTGNGGCNKYSANFKQIGYTGFNVKSITKTRKACKVLIPYKAAKSINVGSWEGSYIRTLKRMGSVRQVTDTRLHFFNRNGEVGMKFRKVKDENKQAAEAAKKAAAEARKIALQQKERQAAIKKALPVQNATSIDKKSDEQPVVRKINTSDDDLIAKFFKTLEF